MYKSNRTFAIARPVTLERSQNATQVVKRSWAQVAPVPVWIRTIFRSHCFCVFRFIRHRTENQGRKRRGGTGGGATRELLPASFFVWFGFVSRWCGEMKMCLVSPSQLRAPSHAGTCWKHRRDCCPRSPRLELRNFVASQIPRRVHRQEEKKKENSSEASSAAARFPFLTLPSQSSRLWTFFQLLLGFEIPRTPHELCDHGVHAVQLQEDYSRT